MKHLSKLTFLLALAFCISAVGAQAQSKKKLKEEVDRLTSANAVLTQKYVQVESQNRKLSEEVAAQQKTITRLKRDSAAMSMDNKLLSNEYQAYKQQIEAAKAAEAATAAVKAQSSYVDPNDNRACARKQGVLASGYSYTMNLNRLNSNGWGVQVYSSDNLCNAYEKAEAFKKYYTMYKTYIRVKVVDGRQIFSVVYASLKDYEQAKTYCRLFKENARPEDGNGAFLVQH